MRGSLSQQPVRSSEAAAPPCCPGLLSAPSLLAANAARGVMPPCYAAQAQGRAGLQRGAQHLLRLGALPQLPRRGVAAGCEHRGGRGGPPPRAAHDARAKGGGGAAKGERRVSWLKAAAGALQRPVRVQLGPAGRPVTLVCGPEAARWAAWPAARTASTWQPCRLVRSPGTQPRWACSAAWRQVEWHKGTALVHLVEALGLAGQPDVVAIYIGDDHTDEDAFRTLEETRQGATERRPPARGAARRAAGEASCGCCFDEAGKGEGVQGAHAVVG